MSGFVNKPNYFLRFSLIANAFININEYDYKIICISYHYVRGSVKNN